MNRICLMPPIFNPANLTLNGWWRGSYSASPWAGTASAGTSNANALSEATNPPTVGLSVNGFTAAAFDGSNDILTGAALSTFLSASAYSMAIMLYVDSYEASAPAGSGEILSDTAGYFSMGTYPLGVSAYPVGISVSHNDGSWKTTSGFGLREDTLELVFIIYDSAVGQLKAKKAGSSAWSYINGVGNLASLAGTLRVGASRSAYSKFFDGQVEELMMSPTVFSEATMDSLIRYFQYRYNTSF